MAALHAAGKLHRDIKPSNTLVRPDGHTLLLDFGLVSSNRELGSPTAAGTVPYMSPEVVGGQAATEASDWYAVGTVLYACLTGRLPFEGSATEVLRRKQQEEPAPVHAVAPGAPADLASLADALVRRRPQDRLDGEAITERLGLESPVRQVPFVGRRTELDTLGTALAQEGQRIVTVQARSGVGKTALIDAFLAQQDDVLVLRSRCYEREAAAFKALDPLVDVLSVYLEGLPPTELRALVPSGAGALGRLFPVLTRLGGAYRTPPELDGVALREAATEALGALLLAVAARGRLVVVVDDLQWGDLDSVSVLGQLLRAGVPGLWVFAWRIDDPAVAPLVEALPLETATQLHLAPLPAEDAVALAAQVVGERSAAERLASDSAGHPFLLVELAYWMAEHGSVPPDLESVLDARLDALPDAVRALLSVVAVAGSPLEGKVAIEAARRIEPSAGASALALLRARRLVASPEGLLTCAHDRIRERVRDTLAPDALQQVHRTCSPCPPPSLVVAV